MESNEERSASANAKETLSRNTHAPPPWDGCLPRPSTMGWVPPSSPRSPLPSRAHHCIHPPHPITSSPPTSLRPPCKAPFPHPPPHPTPLRPPPLPPSPPHLPAPPQALAPRPQQRVHSTRPLPLQSGQGGSGRGHVGMPRWGSGEKGRGEGEVGVGGGEGEVGVGGGEGVGREKRS
ncbi:unnamed protein product [Closterium sp. Naga37s-1]|nr:unnamed protein product [Closterium sp. Naga37s-1]